MTPKKALVYFMAILVFFAPAAVISFLDGNWPLGCGLLLTSVYIFFWVLTKDPWLDFNLKLLAVPFLAVVFSFIGVKRTYSGAMDSQTASQREIAAAISRCVGGQSTCSELEEKIKRCLAMADASRFKVIASGFNTAYVPASLSAITDFVVEHSISDFSLECVGKEK